LEDQASRRVIYRRRTEQDYWVKTPRSLRACSKSPAWPVDARLFAKGMPVGTGSRRGSFSNRFRRGGWIDAAARASASTTLGALAATACSSSMCAAPMLAFRAAW